MQEFIDKRLLMRKPWVVAILLVCCNCIWSISIYGQTATEDCGQKLSHAEAEFSAGHFYTIPSILKECLEGSELSKDQQVRGYLILCQAYLIIDDPGSAGDSYLKLLEADPEFVPNDTDHPIDIVYLSRKYTATPIFTPHFRFGVNTSFFRSIYSITPEPYGVTNQRPLTIGIQLGGGLDWNIDDNFSLCVELDFSLRGYQRIQNGIGNTDESSVVASQSWLDMPLYAKYTFAANEKLRPFGYVGFAVSYLFSASNQFTYTDNKPTGAKLVSEGPAESVIDQRNQLNRSWLVGGGVRYKIGHNFVYADLRYMGGLSNIANQATIYYEDPANIDNAQIGNPDNYLSSNTTRYHYVSDLFRLDNLSLTVGYVHPLYKPRKLKKARTRDVARNIKKETDEEK